MNPFEAATVESESVGFGEIPRVGRATLCKSEQPHDLPAIVRFILWPIVERYM